MGVRERRKEEAELLAPWQLHCFLGPWNREQTGTQPRAGNLSRKESGMRVEGVKFSEITQDTESVVLNCLRTLRLISKIPPPDDFSGFFSAQVPL